MAAVPASRPTLNLTPKNGAAADYENALVDLLKKKEAGEKLQPQVQSIFPRLNAADDRA
jgi:hypothetical protein